VATATRPCDRDALVRLLRSAGVAAAPVNSSKDVLEDPDLVARGYWQHVEHPVIGQIAISRPPFQMSGVGTDGRLAPPPLLGEHTHAVARELLGLQDAEIVQLEADGVLA
jgi:benzylsuccinate CoA-transferase BbsF subunit